MENEDKFFSLNHIEHFKRGFHRGINMEDGVMKFDGGSEALFVSKAFDTCESGTTWHRATASIEKIEGVRYSLSFYASNTHIVKFASGGEWNLDTYLADNEISSDEKALTLLAAKFWSREFLDAQDILLHEFKGRYLWIKLVVAGVSFPKIMRIRLYYPLSTFTRYLPGSYQTDADSFFVKFVSIFQSLYLDLDEKIAAFHKELDYDTASPEALKLLAGWLGFDRFLSIDTDKLRKLMAEAALLYRIWGTKASLTKAIMIICGETPYIQEHFESAALTVLISDKSDRQLAASVIEAIKPAHASYNLIILKQSLVLDGQTYLGVNSRLSAYPPVRLDSSAALGIYKL